jgi:hypothetical protein
MSDDRFFERLRENAQQLRYEPQDDALWTRLPARIRARIEAPATVAQLLARWFRPVTASLAAVALAASLSIAYVERSQEATTLDQIASSDIGISIDGDFYSVGQ